MKTLLTGIAGTGKSTIIKALSERGIAAIDLHDVPDLFFWQDKTTKEKVEYTPGRPKEWFANVDRLCDINKLKEILNQYDDVVVAGTTSGSNQKEFLSNFDKIILLQADSETLVHRMQTRTNKSGYGKSKGEQDDNIEWQKEYDPLLLSLGAIPVDTKGDLDKVVDKIVELLN
jgi:broad-specificity NMP kinase